MSPQMPLSFLPFLKSESACLVNNGWIIKKQGQKRVTEQLNNNHGLKFDRQKYGTENVKEKTQIARAKKLNILPLNDVGNFPHLIHT